MCSLDMKSKLRMLKFMVFLGIMLSLSDVIIALPQIYDGDPSVITPDSIPLSPEYSTTLSYNTYTDNDSLSFTQRFIHRVEFEGRPAYILPTNSFLRGNNENGEKIRNAFSGHVKYSFQSHLNTSIDRIYSGAYQGIGLSYFTFGERKQLGDPFAFYLFQGARIARLSPRVSFNYEWNFGLSVGWNPYHDTYNSFNKVIGSKINAYLNANFYFNWMLSPSFDLTTGLTVSHFSNGNTKFPNSGLNTLGLKVGLVYNFNRYNDLTQRVIYKTPIPEFERHISYDLVFFGSWRRKGVVYNDGQVPSPDAYTVLGFNFAPMYNLGYRTRVGVSLDGVYDGSANVYTEDYISGTSQEFKKPPLNKQLALGLSARTEYVMPYFTVGIGMGVNVLHKGGDMKAFYQILALKIEVTRNSFIHIGYSLHDFHDPNFLMLGIGFRFNNKYPKLHL